jgi:hypothetical protein
VAGGVCRAALGLFQSRSIFARTELGWRRPCSLGAARTSHDHLIWQPRFAPPFPGIVSRLEDRRRIPFALLKPTQSTAIYSSSALLVSAPRECSRLPKSLICF